MDGHVVSLLSPKSFEAEQYRTLRHTVEDMRFESGLTVIAVTSPAVGDGKTTTSVNLAATLAQNPDSRVLLIDADLRRGSVARALGERDAPGLADAILDPTLPLGSVTRRLPQSTLSVVTAGRPSDRTYETLAARRLRDLLEEARQGYDLVVVDTPPLLPLADCRALEPLVDGILIVVAAHRTPRRLLTEALHLVDPTKVRGLVFNADDRPLSGYSSYYSYYSRVDGSRNGTARRWWQNGLLSRAMRKPA